MPDGSQHNTGTAGSGFANSTSSKTSSSAWWNVTENGTVLAAHDGPAASFTGLPSPAICNSTDDNCVYGAGNDGAWSQAARLADGSYVTCTAFVWLCGHFGVPAELAGIHAWRSDDSYHWTWVGRAAALTELPGYSAPFDLRYGNAPINPEEPAWFGPGEGPNEHDLVLLADEKTLMVVFRVDSSDGVPPFCTARHMPKNYYSAFSSNGGTTWTTPAAMHDVNGRGMGTAFPRLLMLGGEDDTPKRLLLSGGRVYTEGIIDMEVWVNSDGLGRRWDQVRKNIPSFPLFQLLHISSNLSRPIQANTNQIDPGLSEKSSF